MPRPKWPLFYLHIDPVWSLLIIGTGCTLGRAPHTNETLPDFREWCRVTRHSRVFRGLTGCQRTPRFWGVTILSTRPTLLFVFGLNILKYALINLKYFFYFLILIHVIMLISWII